MRNSVFNTPFENMLRILLLCNTFKKPANADRLVALDFICIFGKKCKVLDKNLHGDNEFGFSEFTTKRERITEAIKLAVKNNFLEVEKSGDGFLYSISERGIAVVKSLESPYAHDYTVGAKIVCNRFASFTDEGILKYISDLSTEAKEG